MIPSGARLVNDNKRVGRWWWMMDDAERGGEYGTFHFPQAKLKLSMELFFHCRWMLFFQIIGVIIYDHRQGRRGGGVAGAQQVNRFFSLSLSLFPFPPGRGS